ncbi:MAG: ABC transporter [Gemmatimonadetes bacterium]|nr:ABC transporter [Gemmatimonadota bacterium]HCK10947.1 ABC transporter [Candidatus Latescibacterota bacterium]
MSSPYIESAPTDIERKIADVSKSDVCVRVQGDLSDARIFGSEWLVVTLDEVLVVPENDVNGMDKASIADLRDVRIDDFVGGGVVEFDRLDGPPIRIGFSQSMRPKFAEIAESVKAMTRGEALVLPEEIDDTQCESCGRLLPEKNGVCAVCMKKWDTFQRIVKYMLAYPGLAAATGILTVLSTVLALLPPKITQHIIDDVLTPRSGAETLAWFVGALLLVRLVMWAGDVGTRMFSRRLGFMAIADLREDLYQQFQMLPLKFYDRRRIGSLISRMTNDSDRLEHYMIVDVPFILSNTLTFFGILCMLFYTSWELALLICIPIPPIVYAGSRIWARMMRYWNSWGAKWSRLYSQLNESINGIRVVKAFAQEDRESERFGENNDAVRDVSVIGERNWFVFFTVTNFLMSCGVFMVWYFGGLKVLEGQLTLGQLMLFISYMWLMYQPLRWFGDFYNFMLRAFAGAKRIFEVIDHDPEPFDNPNATPLPSLRGRIRFDQVNFGYDPGKPVLKGVEFDVQPGEMIGLVGKSGAGKSTLINLICRFYDPDRGSVLVDGMDMRDVSLRDLRSQIGMVHQEPFLFDGTIAENIAYGKQDATLDDVIRAAVAAEAHEFVVKKPDGYDMRVGERGNRLSGGEKQRISIARAILHNPRILILDEATSSLDTSTERKIQRAIGRLVEGRTTFAIAHRLSTLRSANRLIVMDEGCVAEVGTHEELMERQGIFYRLVKTQQDVTAIMGVGKNETT